ncbi:hypothetical protein R20233_02212 [Ralstonia sp. LMG 32965]|nr:hypothetical protein R20233_02212 [Ralstonia sp. LMG 32965]
MPSTTRLDIVAARLRALGCPVAQALWRYLTEDA